LSGESLLCLKKTCIISEMERFLEAEFWGVCKDILFSAQVLGGNYTRIESLSGMNNDRNGNFSVNTTNHHRLSKKTKKCSFFKINHDCGFPVTSLLVLVTTHSRETCNLPVRYLRESHKS